MNNINLDLSKFKSFYNDNQKTVRMAALILIVGLSILFFWIHGDNRNVEIDDPSDTVASDEDITYDEELAEGDEGRSITSSGVAYVDISGEVRLPGVYKVTSETRLFQVIDMAGGLTEDADANTLNQAEKVSDGQKIIVRAIGEETDNRGGEANDSAQGATDASGKVNINIADLSTLQTIPGIGPAKAQSIIDYRETNGYFTSIEEIMFVSGIGEKTFASIKDQIVV